jgi:cytochrome c peroxidase
MNRTFVLLGVLFLFSCSRATQQDVTLTWKYPSWFPPPTVPADNQPTILRNELGRRLFFDTRLSSDKKTSCASCHVPSSAFTDGQPMAKGAHGSSGKRNTPSLQNLLWMPYFMMEGGVPSLEMQVLSPTQDSAEMGQSIVETATALQKDPLLNDLSKAAYGRELDVYVITRALAAYQRSFISADSRFDRYFYQNKKDQLSSEEIEGMELFFSEKTLCGTCHNGPQLTDYGFYNIGLYSYYEDSGLERASYSPEDSGKFKTPSLRNIELTAPYMHDGSIGTLAEVVDFFNSGGAQHRLKHPSLRPLELTVEQKASLVAFLRSLTDWTFVQRPEFLPLEQ